MAERRSTAFLEKSSVMRHEDFFVFAETVPHIVWMAGAQGDVEYFNREGLEYTGGALESTLGSNWIELIHPDDIETATTAWSNALAAGTPYEVEYRLRRHDGAYRWHRVQAVALRDADGEIEQWIGEATDINDEREGRAQVLLAERRTAETLTLLETLQRNAPVGFGFIDLDFRIVRVNEALAAARGDTPEAQVGHLVKDLVPTLWPTLEPIYRTVLATGEPVANLELAAPIPADGDRVHHTLSSYYPVRLEGEIIGIGMVVVDITERIEAEEAQRQLTSAAVGAIAAAVEARDPYTAGHQRRVAAICKAIAGEIGLTADETDGIELAATIHDIGKLGVPLEILACPRRLMPAEFELVKTHSQIGSDIVAGIKFTWPVAEMILQHHERLDGSGYPRGLHDEQIITGARIIAVADTVEAMGSHRPYRAALGIDAALAEIEANRGRLYDADVADACIRLFRDGRLTLETLEQPTRQGSWSGGTAGISDVGRST